MMNIYDERLSVVDEFQHLGITFSREGCFKSKEDRLVQQAKRAVFYVLRKSRKLCLPLNISLQSFDSIIVPIVTYGAEESGYEENDTIERLHLAIKNI